LNNPPVILSEISASQSEALTQSKDVYLPDTSTTPVILREAFFAERRTRGSHRAAARSLRRNKREATFLISLAILLLTALASAQTLTGTVKNSTTNKPAAGDEVVLLKLGQGMEEAGRTKTDAQGHFSFKLDDAQSPHLVRAIHQDVTYHRMAPPGTTSVELEVFDVAKKIDGISVVADIMRVEVSQGQMQVTREFGVQNTSKPPRTQMNEHNLEFYIPNGAQIIPESASATTENGNPLKSAPVPEGEKNRYSFIFPLRPGLTRFEVAYQLPYTGSANLDPKSLYALDHFVVMVPKTMQFTSASPSPGFKLINYPARTSPSKFPAKAPSNPLRKPALRVKNRDRDKAKDRHKTQKARKLPAPVRRRPAAPAEDSARPSTLPTHCSNTAGRSSEASPQP
jgi:hypothetical protein